jgi:hypothetical protein
MLLVDQNEGETTATIEGDGAMKSWRERVRGALGMGVTWAVGWAPIGALYGAAMGILPGFGLLEASIMGATMFGALGFVGGGLFSTVLVITNGRRRFEELATPSFAAIGTVGGVALGVLGLLSRQVLIGGGGLGLLESVVIVGITGLLGTASAAGTLAIARRADDGLLAGSR